MNCAQRFAQAAIASRKKTKPHSGDPYEVVGLGKMPVKKRKNQMIVPKTTRIKGRNENV